MQYQGFIAQIDFAAEAGLFRRQMTTLRDSVTFQGRGIAELPRALAEWVENYREFCAQRAETPGELLSKVA